MPPTTNQAARLRARGFRLTTQRQLILEALGELGSHVTPDCLYARVRGKLPTVNRATVYRSLDALCDARLVVAARIGRQTVYELAGAEPHHHLVCRACGAIQALEHAAVTAFYTRLKRRHGFVVDMDHLALYGLCAACQAAG